MPRSRSAHNGSHPLEPLTRPPVDHSLSVDLVDGLAPSRAFCGFPPVVPVERVGVDLTLEKRTSLLSDLVVRWNVVEPERNACLLDLVAPISSGKHAQ